MATLSTVISYGEPTGTIVTEIGTPGPTGQTGPQGPPGPTFTGGPITSPITFDAGTNSTAFENGDIFAQDNTSGSYGAIYTGGLQASDGDLTIDITGAGITFGDSTFQSTAFPGSGAFYPSTGNPSGFLTSSALTGYATESFVTSQGYIGDAPSDGSQYARQDGAWSVVSAGGSYLPLAGGTMTGSITSAGVTHDTEMSGELFGVQLSADHSKGSTLQFNGLNTYEPGYYTSVAPTILKVFESTNELGVTIAHDSIAIQHIDTPNVTGYVTNEYIGFEDIGGSPHSAFVEHDVITVQDETNTTQMRSTGISLSSGGSITFGDATVQTTAYTGGGGFITSVSSPLAVASGDLSIDLTGYATESWVSSQDYLTNSAAASTYQTQAGMVSYARLGGSTFTGLVQVKASNGAGAGLLIPLGYTPSAPLDGEIWNAGSAGLKARLASVTETLANQSWVTSQGYLTSAPVTSVAGRTGAITLAIADVSGAAPLASPSLTGTPLSTTAAADTNTTQIATTAFVVGQASSATPVIDGTATVGTSLKYARADHVHPTDTSRAAVNSPAFTGTPSLPTGTTAITQTVGNNTTAVATTAFVTAAVPAFATETEAIVGTSSTTVINPLQMRNILANAGYTAYTSLVGNYSSYVSGSASVATLWSNFVGLSVTAANGKIAFMPNSNGTYHPFTSRGKAELTLDCTKPTWFSFRVNYSSAGTIGDSNTVNRVTIGKVSSYFGDLTSKGFGVKWTAGTTGAFTVMAHNGTTLTTVASAVTISNTTYFPSTTSAADFLVYSDGTGNVTLYCNGVQVATTIGGPSSGTIVGSKFVTEADNTTSTSGTVAIDYTGIRTMYSY